MSPERLKLKRGHGLDRELQILAVGIIDLGNARAVIEHAAKIWRTRLSIQHATGRVRKRDRIDLMSMPGTGCSGSSQSHHDDDESEPEATQHDTSPRRQHNLLDKMRRSAAGIKPGCVHNRAFAAGSAMRATPFSSRP
jgi:hypothetical protein